MKHGEMEDTFMHFALENESHDAEFTKLTTTTGNQSKQLRLQEYHIWALQVELCNLKVATATQTTEGK